MTNAEIYIFRDMNTSGRISTALDSIAVSLKSKGINVAYTTELDDDKDEIINSIAQSLQPQENISVVVIPDGFENAKGAEHTTIFKVLKELSANGSNKEKEQLENALGGFDGEFKSISSVAVSGGKSGWYCVINGLKVLLLPVMSAEEIRGGLTAAVSTAAGTAADSSAKASQRSAEKDNKANNSDKAKVTASKKEKDSDKKAEDNSADDAVIDDIAVVNEADGTSDGEKPKKKKLTFAQRFIPMKGDGGKEVVRKIILDIAIIVFIVAAVLLVKYLVIDPFLNNQKYDEIRKIARVEDENATEITTDADGKKIVKKVKKASTKWDELLAINKEVIGWVTIDDTNIDYPVLQHKGDNDDSQYYLHRDIYGNYSGYGSIFADYRSKQGAKSKNVILHGHHMNDGSMFQNLMGYGTYSPDMDFYRAHPTIQFNTPDGDATYKIISVFKTNTLDSHGEFFNYLTGTFTSDAEFMNYVYLVRVRSLIDTGVTCNENDQLLTLSTCSYEYSEFRTVVVARKTRAGESQNVDTSKARANPNPLWPDVYYGGDTSAKPKVSTFKKANKNNEIDWYDGKGNLKGKERMFTVNDTIVVEEPAEDETEGETEPPVTEPPVVQNQSILFNYSTLVLDVGQSDTLEIFWTPENTTDKSIKWVSTNANVATIASGGRVTAVAPGECTITAETSNHKKTSCKIIVNDILATSLTLSSSSFTTSNLGETFTLYATYEPQNASHKVVWATSNTAVATVNNSGVVKINGYGTCDITATIDSLTVTCKVTVNNPQG